MELYILVRDCNAFPRYERVKWYFRRLSVECKLSDENLVSETENETTSEKAPKDDNFFEDYSCQWIKPISIIGVESSGKCFEGWKCSSFSANLPCVSVLEQPLPLNSVLISLFSSYSMVFLIDMSPGLTAFDMSVEPASLGTGIMLMDRLFNSLVTSLRSLADCSYDLRNYGTGPVFTHKPKIFITVLACFAFPSEYSSRPLLQRAEFNLNTVDFVIESLLKEFQSAKNAYASFFSKNFSKHQTSSLFVSKSSKKPSHSDDSKSNHLKEMLLTGVFALKSSSPISKKELLLFTDGVSCEICTVNYDNLVMSLNRENIRCTVITPSGLEEQNGNGDKYDNNNNNKLLFSPLLSSSAVFSNFGAVPNYELLRHLADGTGGKLLNDMSLNVRSYLNDCFSLLHEAILLETIYPKSGVHNPDQVIVANMNDFAKLRMQCLLKNPRVPLVRSRVLAYALQGVGLQNLLQNRIQEGFRLADTECIDPIAELKVKLVLSWIPNVIIEYQISTISLIHAPEKGVEDLYVSCFSPGQSSRVDISIYSGYEFSSSFLQLMRLERLHDSKVKHKALAIEIVKNRSVPAYGYSELPSKLYEFLGIIESNDKFHFDICDNLKRSSKIVTSKTPSFTHPGDRLLAIANMLYKIPPHRCGFVVEQFEVILLPSFNCSHFLDPGAGFNYDESKKLMDLILQQWASFSSGNVPFPLYFRVLYEDEDETINYPVLCVVWGSWIQKGLIVIHIGHFGSPPVLRKKIFNELRGSLSVCGSSSSAVSARIHFFLPSEPIRHLLVTYGSADTSATGPYLRFPLVTNPQTTNPILFSHLTHQRWVWDLGFPSAFPVNGNLSQLSVDSILKEIVQNRLGERYFLLSSHFFNFYKQIGIKIEKDGKNGLMSLNAQYVMYCIPGNSVVTEFWLQPQLIIKSPSHRPKRFRDYKFLDKIRKSLFDSDLFVISGIWTFDYIVSMKNVDHNSWNDALDYLSSEMQSGPCIERVSDDRNNGLFLVSKFFDIEPLIRRSRTSRVTYRLLSYGEDCLKYNKGVAKEIYSKNEDFSLRFGNILKSLTTVEVPLRNNKDDTRAFALAVDQNYIILVIMSSLKEFNAKQETEDYDEIELVFHLVSRSGQWEYQSQNIPEGKIRNVTGHDKNTLLVRLDSVVSDERELRELKHDTFPSMMESLVDETIGGKSIPNVPMSSLENLKREIFRIYSQDFVKKYYELLREGLPVHECDLGNVLTYCDENSVELDLTDFFTILQKYKNQANSPAIQDRSEFLLQSYFRRILKTGVCFSCHRSVLDPLFLRMELKVFDDKNTGIFPVYPITSLAEIPVEIETLDLSCHNVFLSLVSLTISTTELDGVMFWSDLHSTSTPSPMSSRSHTRSEPDSPVNLISNIVRSSPRQGVSHGILLSPHSPTPMTHTPVVSHRPPSVTPVPESPSDSTNHAAGVVVDIVKQFDSLLAEETLMLLREETNIDATILSKVQAFMKKLWPESILNQFVLPLAFVDRSEGFQLFEREFRKRAITELMLVPVDSRFFMYDESLTRSTFGDDFVGEFRVSLWLIFTLSRTEVEVSCYTGSMSHIEISQIFADLRGSVLRISELVNQKLLLNRLYETRTCSIFLQDDVLPAKETEKFDLQFSSKSFSPGQSSCHRQSCMKFRVFRWLSFAEAVLSLTRVLDPFGRIRNLSDSFVYREKNGNIFYLHLLVFENQVSSSVIEEDNVSSTQTSSYSNMTWYGKPIKWSELCVAKEEGYNDGYLLVEIVGIAEPGEEITVRLASSLKNALVSSTVDKICNAFLENPLLELTPVDSAFLGFNSKDVKTITFFADSILSKREQWLSFLPYIEQSLTLYLTRLVEVPVVSMPLLSASGLRKDISTGIDILADETYSSIEICQKSWFRYCHVTGEEDIKVQNGMLGGGIAFVCLSLLEVKKEDQSEDQKSTIKYALCLQYMYKGDILENSFTQKLLYSAQQTFIGFNIDNLLTSEPVPFMIPSLDESHDVCLNPMFVKRFKSLADNALKYGAPSIKHFSRDLGCFPLWALEKLLVDILQKLSRANSLLLFHVLWQRSPTERFHLHHLRCFDCDSSEDCPKKINNSWINFEQNRFIILGVKKVEENMPDLSAAEHLQLFRSVSYGDRLVLARNCCYFCELWPSRLSFYTYNWNINVIQSLITETQDAITEQRTAIESLNYALLGQMGLFHSTNEKKCERLRLFAEKKHFSSFSEESQSSNPQKTARFHQSYEKLLKHYVPTQYSTPRLWQNVSSPFESQMQYFFLSLEQASFFSRRREMVERLFFSLNNDHGGSVGNVDEEFHSLTDFFPESLLLIHCCRLPFIVNPVSSDRPILLYDEKVEPISISSHRKYIQRTFLSEQVKYFNKALGMETISPRVSETFDSGPKIYVKQAYSGGFIIFRIGFKGIFVLGDVFVKLPIVDALSSQQKLVSFSEHVKELTALMHLHSFVYDFHIRFIHELLCKTIEIDRLANICLEKDVRILSYPPNVFAAQVEHFSGYPQPPLPARNKIIAINLEFSLDNHSPISFSNYLADNAKMYGLYSLHSWGVHPAVFLILSRTEVKKAMGKADSLILDYAYSAIIMTVIPPDSVAVKNYQEKLHIRVFMLKIDRNNVFPQKQPYKVIKDAFPREILNVVKSRIKTAVSAAQVDLTGEELWKQLIVNVKPLTEGEFEYLLKHTFPRPLLELDMLGLSEPSYVVSPCSLLDASIDWSSAFDYMSKFNHSFTIIIKNIRHLVFVDKKCSFSLLHLSLDSSSGVEKINISVVRRILADVACLADPDSEQGKLMRDCESHLVSSFVNKLGLFLFIGLMR